MLLVPLKLVYTGEMDFKSLSKRFLSAGFDTRDDLMLQRKLILVTTLQTLVGIICLFFAIYNLVVTLDYAVAIFDAIGLMVSIYAAYLLHIKKKLQQSIYVVVVMLFFFLNFYITLLLIVFFLNKSLIRYKYLHIYLLSRQECRYYITL